MINLDGIRGLCREILRDEYDPDNTLASQDDKVDAIIRLVLMEMSEAVPREVRETVTLTANSPDVDISDIEDVILFEKGEYPIDLNPREIRNVELHGSTITFVMDRRPAGAESAYLYCQKQHVLTESESTLSSVMERVLVLGVVARVTNSLAHKAINKSNVGGGRVPTSYLAWADREQKKYEKALEEITPQQVSQLYSEA